MSPILQQIKETPKEVVQGHKLANLLLRYWKMIAVLFFMVLVHINSKYLYNSKIDEIGQLRKEEAHLKIRQNIVSSELMQITLEENILKRINEKGLGLYPSDTTLILINKN